VDQTSPSPFMPRTYHISSFYFRNNFGCAQECNLPRRIYDELEGPVMFAWEAVPARWGSDA